LAPNDQTAVDSAGLLAAVGLHALGASFAVVVERVVICTLAGSDTLDLAQRVQGTVPQTCDVADFNCDGRVDLLDFFAFAEAFGRAALAQDRQFDFNDDDSIDLQDFFAFAERFASQAGSTAKLMALAAELLGLPLDVVLEPSYPNPFNGQTTIVYGLPVPSQVRIDIYNIAGQRIRNLAHDAQGPGRYRLVWNGRDAAGRRVGNGIYFVRLETEVFTRVRKLMLLE
jgi:hypothetical protein